MFRVVGFGMMIVLLSACASTKGLSDVPFATVTLPGGGFWMGDVFEEENPDATPVHRAIVAPIEMGQFEITFAQYDSFAVATSRPLPDDNDEGRGNRAVVNISWEEAQAFCRHYGFRLPSEVEWEYAARSAGQKQRFAGVDSTAILREVAWYEDSELAQSMPVGIKKPNMAGLYDMSGNVYEWIGDYYEFYSAPDIKKNLATSSMRIIRGGSYKTHASVTQTFYRAGTLSDFPADDIGFRCARTVLP